MYVNDLYIPPIDLPMLLLEIIGPILGIYKTLTDTLIAIPRKGIHNGIFVAVH
jgi:hypothetical protein